MLNDRCGSQRIRRDGLNGRDALARLLRQPQERHARTRRGGLKRWKKLEPHAVAHIGAIRVRRVVLERDPIRRAVAAGLGA